MMGTLFKYWVISVKKKKELVVVVACGIMVVRVNVCMYVNYVNIR